MDLQRDARNAARSIRKTPQDSQPTQAARNCARSHAGEKKIREEIRESRARARATIVNKARDVRGNASRIVRHVIS